MNKVLVLLLSFLSCGLIHAQNYAQDFIETDDGYQGVQVGRVIWMDRNVGASRVGQMGLEIEWEEAKNCCPDGWRLPSTAEYKSMFYSGKLDILSFPLPESDGRGQIVATYSRGEYWTSSGEIVRISYYYQSNRNDYSVSSGYSYSEYMVRCVRNK